jgi:teichuronic acid biosynthesis glycosyltransferase TuaC
MIADSNPKGKSVDVLFVYSGNKSKKAYIITNQGESLKQHNINVNYYPIINRGLTGYLKHVLLLRRYLAKSKFDIIHAHYGLSGVVALLAAGRRKVIISFMGDDLLGSNRSNGKLTLTSKIMVKLNLLLARWFYEYTIVKSPEMLKVTKGLKNVTLCPNGVNLSTFYPVKLEESDKFTSFTHDEINIIFVSDPFRPEKNYRLASEAIERITNMPIKLHTIFNTPNEDLKFFYSSADLLLLTSFHEGSPNVVKEAMACNCPVVSTTVGNVEELFGNTPGCFLTTFDFEDVSSKIKLAIEFNKSGNRSGGRDRISELGLDSDSIASRLAEIYFSIKMASLRGTGNNSVLKAPAKGASN